MVSFEADASGKDAEGQAADVGRKGFDVSGSASRGKLLKIKEFTALDAGLRGWMRVKALHAKYRLASCSMLERIRYGFGFQKYAGFFGPCAHGRRYILSSMAHSAALITISGFL